MNRAIVVAASALALCMSAHVAMAQTMGGGPSGGSLTPEGTVASGGQQGTGNLTQSDFNKLQEYADQARRLTSGDNKGKTLEQLLAEDKATASAMVAAMPLSCDVKEAILATEGDTAVDGKTVKAKTYEVACANGMGYYLVSLSDGKPYGISCYAADATRAADVAAGRKPGAVCQLPPNANLSAMGTALMTSAGKRCNVKGYRWVGQNTKTNTEFDEFACDDNSGYMAMIALPGSAYPVQAITCHDSAVKGLPCKLSDNGIVPAKALLDALAQHNIACDAAKDTDLHSFGQENKTKRYVVEFRCSQRPQGTVAYIPLDGNQAPFEVFDCKSAAAKHGVFCKLTKTN